MKSLVEMHQGVFELISEPGRGTTVAFTLPIRKARADSGDQREGGVASAAA